MYFPRCVYSKDRTNTLRMLHRGQLVHRSSIVPSKLDCPSTLDCPSNATKQPDNSIWSVLALVVFLRCYCLKKPSSKKSYKKGFKNFIMPQCGNGQRPGGFERRAPPSDLQRPASRATAAALRRSTVIHKPEPVWIVAPVRIPTSPT